MFGFVQIIEFKTARIDEVEALIDERRAAGQGASGAPTRATMTADRDRPGYYLALIEFPSYDAAMENSGRPETAEMAARMAALCDGPPTFYNLDVRRSEEL